jgi:hypothetical protein
VKQTGHEKVGLVGAGLAQVRNDIQAVAPVARRHRVEQGRLRRTKPGG